MKTSTSAQVQWIKHPSRDVYTTKTPHNGRIYYGAWLPKAFAERMGMKSFTVEKA